MAEEGFTLFETPLGRCGIAWGQGGVVGVQLPEGRAAETRARLSRRFPALKAAPPPPEIRRAIDSIVALLRGEPKDLSGIRLDMAKLPLFHQRVYRLARTIGPGQTVSYGEVATRIGAHGAARAVGQALGRNPFAIVVPCHRVLAAGGKVGGFSANGGISTKLRMLAIEGAELKRAKTVIDMDGVFGFEVRTALRHLRSADASLAALIDTVGPFRMELKKTPSVFGALAEAIVYQQLHGKAAATIFGRLCALFPETGLTPERLLRASTEQLRGAGLSRNKLLSLRDLAEKTQAGDIPTLKEIRRLDDETIIERLTQVRGIGRWTVEMLLMFRLGRPDVLPVDDFGIRKGFGVTFNRRTEPTPKQVLEYGERWKPYRTAASWYLWRAAERAPK